MNSRVNDWESMHVSLYTSVVNFDLSRSRFSEELTKGVRHFFVAIPKGFHHIPDYQRNGKEPSTTIDETDDDGTVIRRRLSFLEVRQSDLEVIALRGSATVSEFGGLALFGIVGKHLEDLSHLTLRRVPSGKIKPGSETIASKATRTTLMSGIYPEVSREIEANENGFRYSLSNVSLLHLIVLEKTPPPSIENPNAFDEFGISERCPIVFALLREAHKLSHTTNSRQVDRNRIAATLKELEQSGRLGTRDCFRNRRPEYRRPPDFE